MNVPSLMPCQMYLLEQIVRGRRSREIAAALGRKVNSIDQSKIALRRRMGARTDAQAAAIAVARGMVKVDLGEEPSHG